MNDQHNYTPQSTSTSSQDYTFFYRRHVLSYQKQQELYATPRSHGRWLSTVIDHDIGECKKSPPTQATKPRTKKKP
ncbi:MAG: hypothetical protein IPN46_19605 [Saprospiraceae bacterium]|nr:hypothetical protein [Saprospiraceae bacterium]